VSVDLSTTSSLSDWSGASDSLAEIHAGQEDFDHFFRDVFGEFDAVIAEFARQRELWQRQRNEIEADLVRRSAELERQRADLRAERDQLDQESRRCDERAKAAELKDAQGRERLQELERERAMLAEALAATQKQTAQLAEASAQLTETREELTRTRLDVERRQGELEAMREGSTGALPDEKVLEQLHGIQQERDAALRERALLESELEALRCRAAELTESLEEQKKLSSEQHAQWVAELRQQRALLATMASRLTEQKLAVVQSSGQNPSAPRPMSGDDADSALESVVAQFELLRKDVARRRGAASESA